jgi:hypothetical protein
LEKEFNRIFCCPAILILVTMEIFLAAPENGADSHVVLSNHAQLPEIQSGEQGIAGNVPGSCPILI